MKESRFAFSKSMLSGGGLIIFDLSGLKYFVKGKEKRLQLAKYIGKMDARYIWTWMFE